MKKKIIHLICNAHLDPVWFWDYREGLNEGIATCRAMVDLMDEFPEMNFIRGEAAIYRHIEKFDPALFKTIAGLIEAGRWELVGGNWVQPDTNLPGTDCFLRHFETGKRYFRERFGREVEIAWAADSFGHSAGMPAIYRACGFRYYAFSRPQEHLLHLDNPVFHWESETGDSLFCYRALNGTYQSERHDAIPALANFIELAAHYPQRHFAHFVGVGNHGGGATRRHLLELLQYREAHPEVEIKFSTLSRFFEAVSQEPVDFPTVRGELNFALRGCHTSNAKLKFRYRDAEIMLARAEACCRLVAEKLQQPPESFDTEWEGLFFNTFHDILPGSSIDRANHEQCQWLDALIHQARLKEFEAMCRFNQTLTVTVPPAAVADGPTMVPFVLLNPTAADFDGWLELEGNLDYRPLWEYKDRVDAIPVRLLDQNDKPVDFQVIHNEHLSFEPLKVEWRKRLLFRLPLAARKHTVLKLGLSSDLSNPPKGSATAGEDFIANARYRVAVNKNRIEILRDGVKVFNHDGLRFAEYFDPYGSWGGMAEEPEAWTCRRKQRNWRISEVRILEKGPFRAAMSMVISGGNSALRLTVRLYHGGDEVEFLGHLVWQGRDSRLRLELDAQHPVIYQVPGGETARDFEGDVPGLRYCRGKDWALVSDHFSGFTTLGDRFMVNIVRGSLSATDLEHNAKLHPERPATDAGDHRFRFFLTTDSGRIPSLLQTIEEPVIAIMSAATRPRS